MTVADLNQYDLYAYQTLDIHALVCYQYSEQVEDDSLRYLFSINTIFWQQPELERHNIIGFLLSEKDIQKCIFPNEAEKYVNNIDDL